MMTMETHVFTGADGKTHKMKKFMSLPAREMEEILEKLPELMDAGLVGDEKDEEVDLGKVLPVIKFADKIMRAAFIGTDDKYEKVVNELTLPDKLTIFGEWMSGDEADTKKD